MLTAPKCADNLTCEDDPREECDPKTGLACTGICVEKTWLDKRKETEKMRREKEKEA
jgi:hypothetical protein